MNGRLTALLPRRSDYAGIGRTWRHDVVAGVTVGVVALPLALAFGITTGLGAAAGLTTAIVAGVVAAVFGGSPVQVSGPTGAMTVVLVPLVARHGAEAVAVVGVLAGALIVLAGVLRAGRALAYIPWPVVEGFTVGIAVIIFLQQVPAALGVERPEGENTASVAADAVGDALGGSGSAAALALVALVVAVMAVLPRLHRSLPASLLAVAAGTVVASAAGLDVATIGELPSALPALDLPSFAARDLNDYVSAALAVAALAAIESLLSAKVADGLAGTRHDPDRELVGQGLANVAAPLLGGMPATGAIARTAVNVRAGARTRLAAVVHSAVLVAVVVAGSGLVARIPLAVLAGVLVVTAARMVDLDVVRAILRSTRSDAVVLVLTAAATVVFDLIVAVEIGIAVAAVLALRSVARTAAITETPMEDVEEHDLLRDHIVVYRLDGALFFGAAQRFLGTLAQVADVRVVILRMPDVQVLDATGAQALGEIVKELEHRGITVLLKGVRPEHRRVLRAVGVLHRLASEHHLFDDLAAAVAHARRHVERVTDPGWIGSAPPATAH